MTEGRGGELLFKIALAVKGLDGAIELIGAIVLLLIPTATVQALINDVISRDLLGPPDGSLATHFVSGTADFVSGNRTFAVLYLGLHGIVKLVLVAAMLRRIRPAYPVAVVVLGAFVVYEIYRATQTGSVLLPFLAALDVAIIVLIIREYRNLPATQAGPGH
jgi:uncharacterized membrane protein